MSDLPKRRWFRFAFSLRTLFVLVTVLCCWMAWNVHRVQGRTALERTKAGWGAAADPSRIPIFWRLLGAQAMDRIIVDEVTTQETVQALHLAFPEATIVIDPNINLHRGYPPYNPQPNKQPIVIPPLWDS